MISSLQCLCAFYHIALLLVSHSLWHVGLDSSYHLEKWLCLTSKCSVETERPRDWFSGIICTVSHLINVIIPLKCVDLYYTYPNSAPHFFFFFFKPFYLFQIRVPQRLTHCTRWHYLKARPLHIKYLMMVCFFKLFFQPFILSSSWKSILIVVWLYINFSDMIS